MSGAVRVTPDLKSDHKRLEEKGFPLVEPMLAENPGELGGGLGGLGGPGGRDAVDLVETRRHKHDDDGDGDDNGIN